MKPERIELDLKQVDALLKRVKEVLPAEDYEIIKAMADTIYLLSQSLDQKATSIRRLLRMLFGATTEKLEKNISGKKQKNSGKAKESDKKGHGRKGAQDYTGAKTVNVPYGSLKPGDKCPECLEGKLYEMKEPKKVVRITGNAPLSGTVYQMQRLRCNVCGKVFTAKPPEGIGEEKYDARSKAVIAVLKYGTGMPFNRLENLQQSLGIPLPASTQFEIVSEVADTFEPVLEALIKEAAQGDVIYNDDTTMKVLELMQENQQKDDVPRKGIFTTGILSTTESHTIALYFTGRQHAGENLADVLAQRTDRSPPIQMCDALSRNAQGEFKTLLANCMAHGRRNFVDVLQSFPEQCFHVLETLAEVYKNDKIARDEGMDPDERLDFHQQNSGPLMEELNIWFHNQMDQHLVEPNSGLGQAIGYMLRHWDALTLFLREPGAPLDNNLCERALKKAILHRKNALFYKTRNGARVGDLFMSLIHTCSLAGINPVEYFTALYEHAEAILQNPEKWLPWNYTTALQPDLS
jgi:transposase